MLRRSFSTAVLAIVVMLGAAEARAEPDDMVLWDLHVAPSMDQALLSDECRFGPYRLYRQTCVGNELNITLDREQRFNTVLDRVALTLHRYRYLNMNQNLGNGAKFRVKAQLSNLYKQEAEVRVSLRVPF